MVRWRASPGVRWSAVRWESAGLALAVAAGATAGMLRGAPVLGAGLALAWWMVVTGFLFVGLSLLRTYPEGRPFDGLGVPNGLTALRAYLAIPVLLYAAMPPLHLARELLLATAAPIAALDAADGYIARRVGPITELGRALDPAMDTVFFAIATIGCVLVGFVPIWLGALVLARYGLPALGFLALYPWLHQPPQVVATPLGKINTFATALTLGVSSLLVLAGGPAQQVDWGLGALLAITALGHFVILARRMWATQSETG